MTIVILLAQAILRCHNSRESRGSYLLQQSGFNFFFYHLIWMKFVLFLHFTSNIIYTKIWNFRILNKIFKICYILLWTSFIPKCLIHFTSGTITCCYENHSCVKDWKTMQDRVYKTAKWVKIVKILVELILEPSHLSLN